MIDRMKLRTKIVLLVAASLVGLVVLVVLSAFETRHDLEEGRKLQIRSVTEAVLNTVADFHSQEVSGKLTREQAQKAALEAVRTARYGGQDGKTEYFYAYTMGGINIYHVRADLVGKDTRELIKDGQGRYTIKDMLAALKGNKSAFVDTAFPRPGSQVPVDKLQFIMWFEPWDWMIGTGVYMDDIAAAFKQRLVVNLSLAAVILLVVGGLGWSVVRGVLRQVGGEPAEAIEFMARVAEGDLTGTVPAAHKGSMLDSMGNMMGSIRKMVTEINQGSTQLTQGAERISTASRDVAAASEKQADATQSMAAAIEEMTVSINHISESARDTQENSLTSASLSEEGVTRIETATREIKEIASTVSDASTRIRKLEERANQISSIAAVIKEIAGQTNLLALNAAIEAARAGEQGRGFAVVADEVRKLAERTSTATVEIEQMISGIQSDTVLVVGVMDAALPQVEAGVQAADGAAQSLHRIKDSAHSTLSSIRDVAEATKEQSLASTNIAQRVEQISQMVEETNAAMRSTAETATELERISNELNRLVGRFRC